MYYHHISKMRQIQNADSCFMCPDFKTPEIRFRNPILCVLGGIADTFLWTCRWRGRCEWPLLHVGGHCRAPRVFSPCHHKPSTRVYTVQYTTPWCKQKRRQRSSLLFAGPNLFNSMPRELFCSRMMKRKGRIAPGWYEEKFEFIIFLKSSWCKIASAARNWI